MDELDDILKGRIKVASYGANTTKSDTLKILGITSEHLNLMDGLIDQFRKDIPNFLRDDLFKEDDPDEVAAKLYQSAVKASLEYHLFAPFMDAQALSALRAGDVLHSEHVQG